MATRRSFLAGTLALAAAPLWAPQGRAQEKQRVYRIGMLVPVERSANEANLEEFRNGLKELGYVEGQNLHLEYRSGDPKAERYTALAAELAALKVDAIVTNGTPATLAAKNARGPIPVVTVGVVDPVDTGLVASLEKPGGNVTGIAVLTQELEAKRLELLKALAPTAKRIAAFMDMGNPAFTPVWKAIEAAAPALGVQAQLYDVRKGRKLPKAFLAAAAQKADAFVLRIGTLTDAERRSVVELAARHRMPAIYAAREFVDMGGLMSYGVNPSHMYNRAATFLDKILKGAKPGDVAMERPSKFEFIINRRTARALDLVIPPDLLLRSDKVVG
ncbi:MAG TPA: ABC transporter substrate-binding protein [Burkholderiales bacterium]|nr:ABC transporter substrate-binding protein [Burkholderiales bacterium]